MQHQTWLVSSRRGSSSSVDRSISTEFGGEASTDHEALVQNKRMHRKDAAKKLRERQRERESESATSDLADSFEAGSKS